MKKIFLLFSILIITLLSFTVNGDDFFADGKNLYSDNIYMVNTNTGKVVYELDSEELVYPASLTKVMTCIIAIEECESLDETVTIPSGIFDDIYAQGGANMNLRYGEEISVGDLIRATMIRSACDSASALACHFGGSISGFADMMNQKAIEIGATNTHFVNAHGLHDNNHYTTAKDMYLIAEYALKNPTFCDIISAYSCTIPATNKSDERTLYTTIEIENPESKAYYPYVTGVKSGFTDEAGRCLITKATKDGETYLLVTLGANRDRYYESNMAFTDAITLFEYYFAQYSIQTVIDSSSVLGTAKIENGTADSVELKATNSYSTLVALDDKVNLKLNVPALIKAPVKAGEVIGTVTVEIGDESFTENVIATSDVAEKSTKKTIDSLNKGNKTATYIDILSILLLTASAVIIIVFFVRIFRKKNKR